MVDFNAGLTSAQRSAKARIFRGVTFDRGLTPAQRQAKAAIFRGTGAGVSRGAAAKVEAEKKLAEQKAQELEKKTTTARTDLFKKIDTSTRTQVSDLRTKFNQSIRGLSRNQQLRLRTQLDRDISSVQTSSQQQKAGLEGASLEQLIKRGAERALTPSQIKAKAKLLKAVERKALPVSRAPVRRLPTVEVAPTTIQQLSRSIKESTPELKILGKSEFSEGLRVALGVGLGTEKFARVKAKNAVLGLRDADGRRIFNQEQASQLVDLTAEVVEGAAIGGVVGKAATVGRGAIATVLPKALQESKKFKRVIKVLDVAVLSTLTISEAQKLKKTFNEEGQDAAILQLVGLASFGAGFVKTGLKSPAQAQKEFREFSDIVKKTIPTSKRGQASLQKVLSKGKFDALKKLDKKSAKKGKEVKGKIEKRLVNAKDRKEQLTILNEIAGKMKTPEAKANFRVFVEELIDKRVLKVPEIEVIPGVKVSGVPIAERGITLIAPKPKKVTVPKPRVPVIPLSETVARSSQKNKQRVKQATMQREKEAQKSQQTLGQRFAQAQKSAIAQKTAQAQRTKQRQRAAQAFKVPRGLKIAKVPKIPKVPIPFPFPRFPKGKRKVVPVPPKKIAGKGYNVFVRSRGKLQKANINALSKEDAQALGAFVTDQSLAANFRVRQTQRKVKKPKVKFPKSYYLKNQTKFREFKVVKGKRKKTPDSFIEVRGKRLDTLRERQKIQAAKLIAQLKKGARKAPVKIKLKSTSTIKGKRRKKK